MELTVPLRPGRYAERLLFLECSAPPLPFLSVSRHFLPSVVSFPDICSPILFDNHQEPLLPSSPHSTTHAVTPSCPPTSATLIILFIFHPLPFSATLIYYSQLFSVKLNKTKVIDVCLSYTCLCTCACIMRDTQRKRKREREEEQER